MRILAVLMFLLPLAAIGQTVKSYEQAMKKIQKFYNTKQGERINAMFEDDNSHYRSARPLWTNAKAAELLKEYGRLESFKFVGIDTTDPNKVYIFRTVFSKKGAKTTSFTLNKNNQLGTFRFDTTSDEITRLLQNAQTAGR